jgi:hypothetical protein
VLEGTAARYREAYERITGEPFDAHRLRTGVTTTNDDAALERLREGQE